MEYRLVAKGTSGPLPTSEYELHADGERVGSLQLRHRPSHSSHFPPAMASHVWYEVAEAHRKKGHGTELLKLGLAEARSLGLRTLWLTCLVDNVASRKIIEANGGVLIRQAATTDGKSILKYEIHLT